LHAYSVFFRLERERMVQEGGATGLGNMAKTIAAKWKTLEDSDPTLYDACRKASQEDKRRYDRELATWQASQLAAMPDSNVQRGVDW
jgi:HMG (high mobility group) box